jgi:hypothetical protein
MAVELANYFLASDDERELSVELCALFPSLAFVDGQLWDDATPPIQKSISECASGLAYLWWRDLVQVLPSKRQSSGRYRGPATGCVLQFARCRIRGDHLLLGQMRISTDAFEPPVLSAVRLVFRTLRKKYRSPDHSYLVGPHAAAGATSGMKLAINAESYLIEKKSA